MHCYYSDKKDISVLYTNKDVVLVKGDIRKNEDLKNHISKKYNFSYAQPQYPKQQKPRMMRVLISDYCNINCKYCKVQPNISYEKKRANYEAMQCKINDFIADAREFPIIEFSGGEPLVEWDALKKLVDNSIGIEKATIIISTNSLLLDEEKLSYIEKKGIKLLVSIDGREESHDKCRVKFDGSGTHSEVIKKLDLISQYDIEFGLSFVAGKHSINTLKEDVINLCEKYNPASVGINFLKYPTFIDASTDLQIKPEEYAFTLYDIYKELRYKGIYVEQMDRRIAPFINGKNRVFDCGATLGNVNLNSHGDMGPCKSFLVLNKKMIKTKDKEYHDMNMYDYIVDLIEKQERCHNCFAKSICGGGCMYEAVIEGSQLSHNHCRIVSTMMRLILEDICDLYDSVLNDNKENSLYINKEMKEALMGNIKRGKAPMKYSIGHYLVEE